MTGNFTRWHRNYKIAIFLAICLFLMTGNTLIFIVHPYAQVQKLKQQQKILNQRWLQRRLTVAHNQRLQRDIRQLQNPFQSRLRGLHRLLTPAALYKQIAFLAKVNHLQILALKPQKFQSVAGLEQRILNIDMNGAEFAVLNFLQLLMHQFWLLEIQKIELSTTKTGVHLQASLAAYYAAV